MHLQCGKGDAVPAGVRQTLPLIHGKQQGHIIVTNATERLGKRCGNRGQEREAVSTEAPCSGVPDGRGHAYEGRRKHDCLLICDGHHWRYGGCIVHGARGVCCTGQLGDRPERRWRVPHNALEFSAQCCRGAVR